MDHGRRDYDEAIQAWPYHRGHLVKDATGKTTIIRGTHDRTTDEALEAGRITPIIPQDEPVFLLRSKDKFFPQVTQVYIGALRNEAMTLENNAGPWSLEEETEGRTHIRGDHGHDVKLKPAELRDQMLAQAAALRELADLVANHRDKGIQYADQNYAGGKAPDGPELPVPDYEYIEKSPTEHHDRLT